MQLAEFVLAVLLMELTPGPNMAYLAALSLAQGRAAALYGVLGVAAGLAVHAALAALGVGAAVAASPWFYQVLRWAGVAFMLFLAWEGWRGADAAEAAPAPGLTAGRLVLRGFVTNVLNPKSIMFFVAVVPGFIAPGAPVTPQLAMLGSVYVGIATAVHLAIILGAAALRPWLMAGHRIRLVRRGLSLLLVLAALWLAWSTGLR